MGSGEPFAFPYFYSYPPYFTCVCVEGGGGGNAGGEASKSTANRGPCPPCPIP